MEGSNVFILHVIHGSRDISIAANAKMSDRASASCPSSCSGDMRTASAKAADEFQSPRLSQRAFTTDRDLEICFTNRIRRRNETELFQAAKRDGGGDGKDADPGRLSDLVVDVRKVTFTAKLVHGTQNEPVEWFE